MLVLSRKVGEKLHIGDAVVEITKVAGRNVTLGIEAPAKVKVVREELLRKERQQDDEPAVA